MNLELYLARGVQSDGSRLNGGVGFSRISFQGMLIAVRVVRGFGLLGALQVKGSSEGFLYLPEATRVLAWQRFGHVNAKRSREPKFSCLAPSLSYGSPHLSPLLPTPPYLMIENELR
jgi:hypothetical protein